MWQLPRVETITDHVYIYFDWIRATARADKDNVAFAKKFVLDALQKNGVIERDSWRKVTPLDNAFRVNKTNPRTIITICTDREDIWKN